VDRAASQVAGQQRVRAALLDFQRQFGAEQGAVLDGRDIGTVIFPEAPVKLFITASIPCRAERRWLQNTGGGSADPAVRAEGLARMAEELAARDAADAARSTAPLRAAPDAIHIDTDRMDAQAVLAEALRVVRERVERLSS
jgi:cytidylate kinase